MFCLKKKDILGFRGVLAKWFDSYLTNRKMMVDIHGHKSATKELTISLSQRAVSSPYLFSLYINDMHQSSEKVQFNHFADDCTVYLSGNNLESVMK